MRRGIHLHRSLLPALGLLCLLPGPLLAQDHRLIGDTPELGAWVEAAAIPLVDDGTGADAVAGDGVFTASVSFAAAALPGPRTLRWLVLPEGATLAAGAVGQADGSPMRVDLPDEQARTLEFRFTPTAPAGFGPEPGLADSFTSGLATDPTLRRPVAFLAQGGFQRHLGGIPWNPAGPGTRLLDDGQAPDALAGDGLDTTSITLPLPLDPTDELEWSVGAAGSNAIDRSLELGADGWGFAADGVSPAPFTLTLEPWQPGRFELDRLRGMARVVVDEAAFEAPQLSEVADAAVSLSWVELHNPGTSTLALDGLFLTDDPLFALLPSGAPPAAGAGDATAAFPPGAHLPAGGYLVIAWPSPGDFHTTFGRFPDLELLPDVPAVPEMVPTHAGAIDAAASLDPAGEFLLLGRHAATDALVEDVDLVTWGAPAAGELFDDRVDTTPSGAAPAYGLEAGTFRGEAAPGVGLHARKELGEGAEARTPCVRPCPVDGSAAARPSGLYDGAAGARHDETSEPLATTWALARRATPGEANAVARFVSGRVEDGAGGGVLHADVEAVRGAARVAALSDAAGDFRLGPLEQGTWSVQARQAAGGVSQVETIRVEGDLALPSPLVLDGSPLFFTLDGVVLDAGSGAGLAGATLTAVPGQGSAIAGAGGSYSLGLPAGAYTLVASAPGYAAADLGLILGSDQTRNFSLSPGSPAVQVAGVVSESGGPALAGARLSLQASGRATQVVASAGDGSFLFPAVLPATTYRLQASAPGHRPLGMDLIVADLDLGGLALELEALPATRTISGTVLDARDDTPLEGATVILEGAGGTLTDAAGVFALDGLVDGPVILLASLEGFLTTRQPLTLAGADLPDQTLRLMTDHRLLLEGRVIDASDGTPLAGATLELTPAAGGATQSVITDDAGRFSWVQLREGDYTLTTSATDHLPDTRTLSLAADTLLEIPLSPDPDRRISLAGVVALEGQLVGGWEDTALSLAGPTPGTATTAVDGTYRFEDLVPGSYVLTASHAGFLEVQLPLELSWSSEQDLVLALDEPASSPEPGCSCSSPRGEPASLFALVLLGCIGLIARRRR
ncbi:MAG: carboxypeptidase regulatory-like domain-containing protein [Deltaproteobacteria bacterium]|nr:carboxypeptidase regulatory-like domain-containing protein [Deltaproteobacteria bacterium]